ncbi:22032_t:CDS:2 [Dentiscutata erythropus]|uniref:22032_t:CDS:1 n=1 Tax=Dentiscutata erythropus TaxID=1348616 RepID=A0A9N9I6T3_9GLOM|nr:22032_t:CDS:2 [Dentiscutata erythropus]
MSTNQSFTIAFKLEIISYTKTTSNCKAFLYYNINRKCVQEWRKQKEEFEKIKNSKGLNIEQPTLEKELLEYIKKRKEEKGVVTTSMIIKKAKSLGKVMNITDTKFSHSWAECFKQQHKLVKRVWTQIAQKIPEDLPLIIKDFFKTSCEKMHTIEKKFIISFDETPMWFDMLQNSTINFKDTSAVPSGTITEDLMIFTYILQAVRARPNGFFKSKSIIFVDTYCSYNCGDVIKALNAKGIWILDSDSSEDDKMSQCLQTIVKNHLNELLIENTYLGEKLNYDNSEPDNELGNDGPDYYELDNTKPDNSKLNDKVNDELGDIEPDYYDENFVDLDSYEEIQNKVIEID